MQTKTLFAGGEICKILSRKPGFLFLQRETICTGKAVDWTDSKVQSGAKRKFVSYPQACRSRKRTEKTVSFLHLFRSVRRQTKRSSRTIRFGVLLLISPSLDTFSRQISVVPRLVSPVRMWLLRLQRLWKGKEFSRLCHSFSVSDTVPGTH